MTSRRSALVPGAVVTLLLCSVLAVPRAVAGSMGADTAVVPKTGRRLVAVGDIHGDYEAVVALLRSAGLMDGSLDWSGGDAVLVQTGDFLDRGPRVREVMDLLMRLQRQAPDHGGRVHVLLGNHEILNLVGEVRDVGADAYGDFAGPDSDKLLEEAFDDLARVVLRREKGWRRATPRQRLQVERQWRESHPPGFVEYVRALAPAGEYGRWLRRLPVVVRVGDMLFIHAGIPPTLLDWSLTELNDRVGDEIALFDAYRRYLREEDRIPEVATLSELFAGAIAEVDGLDWLDERPVPALPPPLPSIDLRAVDDVRDRLEPLMRIENWFLLAEEGPLWFRGLARWTEQEGREPVEAVLEAHGVRSIVSGHTPQSGVRARWGGRAFLIDTGMLSSHYGGTGSALEIVDGTVHVVGEQGRRTRLSVEVDLGPIPDAGDADVRDPGPPDESRPRNAAGTVRGGR